MIAVLMPFWDFFSEFYLIVTSYYWIENLGYLIGIATGTFIFTKKLLNLHGITIVALKMKSKDKKIEKLKKELKEKSEN